tara:strand:- start:790 stop:1629 length:840 start_codon:yes stop_codon:yes gene_type:complete
MKKITIIWGVFFHCLWLIGTIGTVFVTGKTPLFSALLSIFFFWGFFLLMGFIIPNKGHGKKNNIFWCCFGNIIGIIYVLFRSRHSSFYLNKLTKLIENNVLPSSYEKELINKSGFNDKHPLWSKYNLLINEESSKKREQAQWEREQEAKVAERQKKKNEEAKKMREEAKIMRAEKKKKREQEKKNKLLAFKKKYGADAVTKALAGKIWVNMSFELYRKAQVMLPNGRKYGKKFENVVSGEERHTYRFDPYENRQGKISYNYEITTKDGLISGWKNLETN